MGAHASSGPVAPGNRILNALPRTTLERLRPDLTEVQLPHHEALFHPGERVRHVYFIDQGLISLVQSMNDGRTVEVGAIGTEGAIGSNAVFGIGRAPLETIVQMQGCARSIAINRLADEMKICPRLSALLQGIAHLQIAQIAQTAGCNRLHGLEQRCCRWLLIAHDNADGDTFPLTQEFLAMMLGVQRPGVTIAARSLQQAGYIRYSRGRITITDRKGLEGAACECYATIRRQCDALFERQA